MGERITAFAVAMLWAAAALGDVSADRQAELRHMLAHDCGSCHGLRLTGGLGPPLTSASLETREVAALKAIIMEGVPGTPMPPWKGLVSGEEAGWLARYMKGLRRPEEETP